jgi:carbamoyltransferase
MGLAPFGKSEKTEITNDLIIFQNSLDWNNAFHHKSKQEWEKSNNKNFQNLAATVQAKLENEYETLIANLKIKYPKIKNLILTGGCALNCTNNAKILKNKYFEKIYIPPFPGDECIGFGLAKAKEFNTHPNKWQPVPYENQSPYWGPLNSIPTSSKIESTFEKTKYLIKKHEDIAETASQLLYDGHIIAWFQGRSESGPRALGNRSILARPDKIGLKNFLNQEIKFRENFRPYGSSVLVEYASLYFQVKPGFENPFMSFAVGVNPQFHDLLKEVTHVDGTSRMQTVRSTQNNLFYKLINAFGNKSQLYCLLNTSLNIMDQPILETVEDAKNFMDNSKVKYLAIGDYLITNPEIDQ